ncbi:hypothetical protein MGG_17089 [Pyricularia oryzae 70-15]|uniref:Uncharacterized protein n=1 Tax=Pyricularia oryzae (strain 70-15 / ATCC MYA-4617 / FGSC 8958) TaxID=242507 RepID=G4N8A9_PYRO7|nr:uncharacterized protein MGG_17089 [Pyricularia oryzae 70-15]EHA50156.1 hypothetical protein MGG_17089 [Pyricularia oryzae 70-15]
MAAASSTSILSSMEPQRMKKGPRHAVDKACSTNIRRNDPRGKAARIWLRPARWRTYG